MSTIRARLAKLELTHRPILGRFIVVKGVGSMDAAMSVLAERRIKVTKDDMVFDEMGEGAPTVEIIDVTQTHEEALEEILALEEAAKAGQHVNAY